MMPILNSTLLALPVSRSSRSERILRGLGSLRFTLLVLALLFIVATCLLWYPGNAALLLVPPLGLLALNLIVAIWIQPRFRSQPALLVFHLALLAVVILVALGRMTYLKGQLELSVGAVFNGELMGYEAGPWHPWHLDKAQFINRGFVVDYAPGPSRTYTANQVSWHQDGAEMETTIGDQIPLMHSGYLFYTSSNKGFAPVFSWHSKVSGMTVTGDLHMPSYPVQKHRQTAEWIPPEGAGTLWFMLEFDEEIIAADRPSQFRLPAEHTLIVRRDKARYSLSPGEKIELKDGTLHYLGLRSWMGYNVFYDWTLPWLTAACFLACAAMGWHFWNKYTQRPWLQRNGVNNNGA